MNENIADDFDFFDVLAGRTYPTDSVTVFMDEQAAYDFVKSNRDFEAISNPSNEQISEFESTLESLRKRINDSKITFNLHGIPDDEVVACREAAEAHFSEKKKQKKAADGTIVRYLPEEENVNYLNYFTAIVLSKHITSVLRHKDDRTITSPSADFISNFMDKAPGAAKDKLNAAVQGLRVDSSDYEASLDEGFFPKS